MHESESFYTQFAASYSGYSSEKKAYLLAVENIIKAECGVVKSLVDVGAGDGKRGERIANLLKVKKFTLIDNSDGMVALLKNIPNATVIKSDISNREFYTEEKYSVVICLWNVFGHISSGGRLTAFAHLEKLVDDTGVIFVDVNNRYNIAQYGLKAVIRNFWLDIFFPKESNGNFNLNVSIRDGLLKTSVHIFNPKEIECLIKSSGLKILKRQIVDYKTGEIKKSIFSGQLVYKLSKI